MANSIELKTPIKTLKSNQVRACFGVVIIGHLGTILSITYMFYGDKYANLIVNVQNILIMPV